MPEQSKEERRALLEKHRKMVEEELAELDENEGNDPMARHKKEDEGVALFDRMQQDGSLVELYHTDRARFDEICRTKRVAGERAFISRNLGIR